MRPHYIGCIAKLMCMKVTSLVILPKNNCYLLFLKQSVFICFYYYFLYVSITVVLLLFISMPSSIAFIITLLTKYPKGWEYS